MRRRWTGGVQPPSTEVALASPQLSEGGGRAQGCEGGKRADADRDRDIDSGPSERLRVDIEQLFRWRPPLGGLGIASRLGTLDDHRARNIESATQLIIDNLRQVAHPVSSPSDASVDRSSALHASHSLDCPLRTAMAERFVLRTCRQRCPTRVQEEANGSAIHQGDMPGCWPRACAPRATHTPQSAAQTTRPRNAASRSAAGAPVGAICSGPYGAGSSPRGT